MKETKQLLISLIIPVHNESANLAWHHELIKKFFSDNSIAHEIIYVDDGSTDNSAEIIKQIAQKDSTVRYFGFSRNFGKEAATTAGLHHARGDAAIMIDADGQHPISLVKDMLQRWQDGYDVIVGVRKSNTDEGGIKKYGSKLFYLLLNSFTSGNTVPGSTDFRLLDRKVIDQFNKLTEHNRITRGLIDWLGYKRDFIEFNAPARHGGEASYGITKLIRLAIHGFVSQTTRPLQLTGFLGGLVMFLSMFAALFLIVEKYLLGDPLDLAVTGTAIIALLLSFLVGLSLICQWLLALYIESIHSETQNRPLYIISEQK